MHTYTIACCATQLVSCSCLQAVLNTVVCRGLHGVCATWQHSQIQAAGMSDRIDTREQACTSIFESVLQLSLCSCGCLQSILVTAVCTGVCAACLETRYSLQVHYTDATLSNRCSDVCWQHAGQPVLFLCRCLLLAAGCCVVTACTGFVRKPTARYSLLVCLTASTHKQTCIRTYVH
jgi:hypothetical protein